METKFTKGEWIARKTKNGVIEIKSDGVVLICEIDLLNMPNYPTPIGSEANAKLIAAAPELLEALYELMDGITKPPPLTAISGLLEKQYKKAEQSIKKATE